eukprot:1186819-Prorocentrum_minimum.AAC.1
MKPSASTRLVASASLVTSLTVVAAALVTSLFPASLGLFACPCAPRGGFRLLARPSLVTPSLGGRPAAAAAPFCWGGGEPS